MLLNNLKTAIETIAIAATAAFAFAFALLNWAGGCGQYINGVCITLTDLVQ
tara:strand:- start:587 stop:739 length:153 start_codon:yes stop_codon:yes gene_type:complete